jgi:hypothetical protein
MTLNLAREQLSERGCAKSQRIGMMLADYTVFRLHVLTSAVTFIGTRLNAAGIAPAMALISPSMEQP